MKKQTFKTRTVKPNCVQSDIVEVQGHFVELPGWEGKFFVFKDGKWNIAEYSTGLKIVHRNNGEMTQKAAIAEAVRILGVQCGTQSELDKLIAKQRVKWEIINIQNEEDLTNSEGFDKV